jgi:outer membrane biosynthesis protein TonB
MGAQLPAVDAASTRRRPTTLDDRKLVPSTLPIVQLDGKSTIPTSLPLESIAARVVVPRDVKPSEFVREERENLPLQPTDLDERVIVPQGAAPPEIIEQIHNIPTDLVETDIFMTGEVNLLNKETPEKDRAELVKSVMSFAAHALFILFLLFEPKIFPSHAPTREENELARRQMTILLPPGALDELKATPRPPPVHVDPKVLRRVAPPVPKAEAVPAPTPTPAPKTPEKPRELPSAPTPQPQQAPPKAQDDSAAKQDAPKQPIKLETPQQEPSKEALLLPKSSLGGSLRDSIRESSKMNAPTYGGGQQLPGGPSSGGGRGPGLGPIEMLTPTEGVDFNAYLRRVYIIVQRNWYAVMPESVRLGDKGVVALQFKIMRNGVVPDGEPVRVSGSGKEPLDRAAISSIRSSTPFEPLPPGFSGPYIELRFTYFYNIQPGTVQ